MSIHPRALQSTWNGLETVRVIKHTNPKISGKLVNRCSHPIYETRPVSASAKPSPIIAAIPESTFGMQLPKEPCAIGLWWFNQQKQVFTCFIQPAKWRIKSTIYNLRMQHDIFGICPLRSRFLQMKRICCIHGPPWRRFQGRGCNSARGRGMSGTPDKGMKMDKDGVLISLDRIQSNAKPNLSWQEGPIPICGEKKNCGLMYVYIYITQPFLQL